MSSNRTGLLVRGRNHFAGPVATEHVDGEACAHGTEPAIDEHHSVTGVPPMVDLQRLIERGAQAAKASA